MQNEYILKPTIPWRKARKIINKVENRKIVLWTENLSQKEEIGEVYKELRSAGIKLAVEDTLVSTQYIKETWRKAGRFKYYTSKIEEERTVITNEIITANVYAYYQCQGFDSIIRKGNIVYNDQYCEVYTGRYTYAEWQLRST